MSLRRFPFKPFEKVTWTRFGHTDEPFVLTRLDQTIDKLSWRAELVNEQTCFCYRNVAVEELVSRGPALRHDVLPRPYFFPLAERPSEWLLCLQERRSKYLLENQFKRSKPRAKLNEDGSLAEPSRKKLNKAPGTKKTAAQAALDKFADLQNTLLNLKKD